MLTLTMTMIPFRRADSLVPRISTAVRIPRMITAGMFIIPRVPVSAMTSNGECDHS
jgi:hypothetical protein